MAAPSSSTDSVLQYPGGPHHPTIAMQICQVFLQPFHSQTAYPEYPSQLKSPGISQMGLLTLQNPQKSIVKSAGLGKKKVSLRLFKDVCVALSCWWLPHKGNSISKIKNTIESLNNWWGQVEEFLSLSNLDKRKEWSKSLWNLWNTTEWANICFVKAFLKKLIQSNDSWTLSKTWERYELSDPESLRETPIK